MNTDYEHLGIEGRQKGNNTYKIIKCKHLKARKEYQAKSISYKIDCSKEKPQKQEGHHKKKKKKKKKKKREKKLLVF